MAGPLRLSGFLSPRCSGLHCSCLWTSKTQADTPTQSLSGGGQHCHPSVCCGSSRDPLATCPLPQPGTIGTGGHALPFLMPGRRGGLAHLKAFSFCKCSASETVISLSFGTVTSPIAEQVTTGRKDKATPLHMLPTMPCCDSFPWDPRKLQYHPDKS